MMAKGHVPKDKVGAAEMGVKLARQTPAAAKGRRRAGEADPAAAADTP